MLGLVSSYERCPLCGGDFVLDSGELVCKNCGMVPPTFDPLAGAEAYGRSPQSHCLYGSIGTNIATKQRNADGSSSESYATKGDNGRYKPITYVMQPWDLLRVVEPESKVRSMKQQIASDALSRGVDEIELSNTSRPIIGVARQIIYAKEHLLVDEYSRETMDVSDKLIYATASSKGRRLRQMLIQMKASFEANGE